MQCLNCGAIASARDTFCPRCGAVMNSRLPVPRAAAPPPALWQQAAPVVARGVALVLAGVVGEWLMRSATRRAARLPFQARKPRKARALARRAEAPAKGSVAISETVVLRRVIVRNFDR